MGKKYIRFFMLQSSDALLYYVLIDREGCIVENKKAESVFVKKLPKDSILTFDASGRKVPRLSLPENVVKESGSYYGVEMEKALGMALLHVAYSKESELQYYDFKKIAKTFQDFKYR